MMISEMYLSSLLQNCNDEYDVRSTLADAGIDYDDVSDVSGKMKLQCLNEKGARLAISFVDGRASVQEIKL